MSVEEDGAVKVAQQRCNMSVFMSEKRLTDPHPHPYYGSGYRHHETLEFGYFEIGQTEKALVAMFAVILVVGILAQKLPRRFCSSLPPPETKVQTVSRPVMHV
ncbi:hypothetical protein D9C73_022484 [Collichthys lucidus]|uniref:Uncharacterized protein n=1 Tax=Collichthys lucidus TaxID=240159 RepID=A0A4U5VPJ4_COLLU|nr:hypothetical protein D9C73_022484 [Collichthys lucidus]